MTTAETQRKQPVQSRSRVTVEILLDATIQVLLREGAARLTTTRVAERAGVSVGTLYQYFPNKGALIAAVRARYFNLVSDTLDTALRETLMAPPEIRLGRAIEALVRLKRENLELSQSLATISQLAQEEDFTGEVVRRFASKLATALGHADHTADHGHSDQVPDWATATVAALEGLMSFAVKNEPHWLHEPWFVVTLKDIANSVLSQHRAA